MMSTPERKVLKDSIDLMWSCYQRIAKTPDNDHWTKIFIRARDIAKACLNGELTMAREEK